MISRVALAGICRTLPQNWIDGCCASYATRWTTGIGSPVSQRHQVLDCPSERTLSLAVVDNSSSATESLSEICTVLSEARTLKALLETCVLTHRRGFRQSFTHSTNRLMARLDCTLTSGKLT